MNVFVNGRQFEINNNPYTLPVKYSTTVGEIKKWGSESFPVLISLNLTFSNSVQLAEIVFKSKVYDNINFEKYKNLLAGGRIDVVKSIMSPVGDQIYSSPKIIKIPYKEPTREDSSLEEPHLPTVYMLVEINSSTGIHEGVYASTNINSVINYWMDHTHLVNAVRRNEGIVRSDSYTEEEINTLRYEYINTIYSSELH